ncbi:DinB family protein [Micromonospora sp. PPF5-17]|uniref:DinB family protein n=1 Tax=Micromonospora solifontis TaxID=2487138 RepID=A0ABX9WEW3_9ACTN|nr:MULTISPECIES: DinB family protein [Micromonospora]NES37371.1 DinB family protein [Micromonospora solifontis]NES58084.1 DinB family protein [Micromonospora sp. PPF5-6]RNL98380.1 DinB family protein [Micromonospora solifontis]
MKADLHSYLKGGRDTLLWKLDGLSEYDIRRPLTKTATNLLGLVKHSAASEILYFGVVFDRPFAEELSYVGDGAETNADMWATADETREEIVDQYRRAIAHADSTIEALALDHVGRVPWWGDAAVTLHHVLVHVIAETQRHAGHADIVRELIDGAAGLLPSNDNLPPADETWWRDHRQRVEQAALDAGRRGNQVSVESRSLPGLLNGRPT